MAYAALVCIKHTIEELAGDNNDVWYDQPCADIMEIAYMEMRYLHQHFKMLDSKRRWKRPVNGVEERLREELCKFEDLLDSHISEQLFAQSLMADPVSFSADLRDLNKLRLDYIRESGNEEDDEDDVSSRLIDSSGNEPMIVGVYSDQIPSIKQSVMSSDGYFYTPIFWVVGMAGIGKTALAKQIFEDPDIVGHFESRAWVKLGRKKYTNVEVARRILAQLNHDSDKLVTEEMTRDLLKILESKRCFIVLDDVWDTEFVKAMKLEDKLGGSRMLFTTRLHELSPEYCYSYNFRMRLMNKEESWDLFRAQVFAQELCPRELVKPGKKIAEKCEGLPLLIISIAKLLSKNEKNLENWNKVVEDKQNRLLRNACKEIQEVLFPSYDHLPHHLKTCFLYMGVFPQDCDIPKSNIINLWIAEGFLELKKYQTLESCAMECLEMLISNNFVLVYQRNIKYPWLVNGKVKTCGLHCSFWYLCNREAEKNKFLHVLSSVEDGLEEGIKGHRRLCIHNNVLFGIKNVYSSIQRVCATTARSLLCFGPYHPYEVPMCLGLRLLRVIDALAIRFYDFPLEVLKLFLLRYLALTCNGKLPPSISSLRRLEFLIVGRHLNIKSSRAPCYAPMEIWDMKELQHLQIMGTDLPHPCGKLLPKLRRLIGVSAQSCTKEILQGIPKLHKLGIQIELEPTAAEPFCSFDHISNLNELESLKYVVVNPMFASPLAAAPFSMMPSSLIKLHLSGLGYPWEYMTIIAALLPKLIELKLRCYAFRGSKWEVQGEHFPELQSLLIEDTDLVQWIAGCESFSSLTYIRMKHCYILQELHLENGTRLDQIELVDCNPVVANHVRQRIEDGSIRNPRSGLVVHCSWNDGNLNSPQSTNWPRRKFLKPQ